MATDNVHTEQFSSDVRLERLDKMYLTLYLPLVAIIVKDTDIKPTVIVTIQTNSSCYRL